MLFVAAQLIPTATHIITIKPNLRMESPHPDVASIIIAHPTANYHGIVTNRRCRPIQRHRWFEQSRGTRRRLAAPPQVAEVEETLAPPQVVVKLKLTCNPAQETKF